MNILKKTLAKDDQKKYAKKKNQSSNNPIYIVSKKSLNRKLNWTNIPQTVEPYLQRATKQKCETQTKIKQLILKSFQKGQITVQIDLLTKSLLAIFSYSKYLQQIDESFHNNYEEYKIQKLIHFLQKLYQNQQKNSISKRQIKVCIESIKKYHQNKQKKQKQKNLDAFDKIMNKFNGNEIQNSAFKKKQDKKDQSSKYIKIDNKKSDKNLQKKLLGSLSSGNLHIKVTKQQISLKDVSINSSTINKIGRKKSHDLNISSVKSVESFKSIKNSGQLKLSNLLKDPNVKLVKTKIQYDYSAIFEASKIKISTRNKTQHIVNNNNTNNNIKGQEKKNNLNITNINKAKKDQGFVFYRPKTSKNNL